MLLTVWRHGEAAPGSPDRARRLTPRGHRDLEQGVRVFTAALAARALPAVDALQMSRWERTRQTAAYVAGATGCVAEAADGLIPGAGIGDAEAMLEALPPAQHRVLVLHQPLVSALVDHWLGEAGVVPSLSPGAFAVLSAEVWAGGCAALLFWAAPPEYGL